MKKIYRSSISLLMCSFLFGCGTPTKESLPHNKKLTLSLPYQDFIDQEQLIVVDDTLPYSMQYKKETQVKINGHKFDVKYYLDKSKGLNSIIYSAAEEEDLYKEMERYLTKIYGKPLSAKEEGFTVWELSSENYGDYFMNLERDSENKELKISIIIKHFPK